ncbi:DinB family protein [Virgibacillus alimentarius]|uniref:DinB family protein n=1 Tax=Virgibacillus alimentarius TaxID=698769 RepID=UPI0029BFEAEF|nr:DinB family protein [Virgibacillus alimentarius]
MILDINTEARQEILDVVSGLSDEVLNKKVEEDRWSIMQVLEHLYLIEKAVTHSIADQIENGENKEVSKKPIEMSVDRSTKAKAPSFAQPSNEFITLNEMKEKLAASRADLTKLAESAEAKILEQRTYPHPAFGDLSLKQWIPFIGYHEKRHLKQIEEVKQELVR